MAFGSHWGSCNFPGRNEHDIISITTIVCVLVFFDDILIYSASYQEHLCHLQEVLQLLDQNEWKVKLSKCAFAQSEIHYLVHVISKKGVDTDETKITAIKDWPSPVDAKQLRIFLGLAGYYRIYVRNYASISKPLTILLHKHVPFVWTSESQLAFDTLKEDLVSAQIQMLPDFSCPKWMLVVPV
jgi:hypothetical protein